MAQELYALRHRFKDAYAAYANSVRALSDAAERGEWPIDAVLTAEEKAFNELSYLRQALLGGLFAHKLRSNRKPTEPRRDD